MSENTTTWPHLLDTLLAGRDLSASDAAWAMEQMFAGELTDAQIAGFLVALRAKGVTGGELLGLADAMLSHAISVEIPGPTLDIVGTGGDKLGTVNLSTMSSLVAVGAGARVVKHGNRGASSTAGAADVIETLGVSLDQPVKQVAAAAEEVGITFLFAQVFHPAMRHVMPARKALGIRTVFNFLGPLSNPARVTAQAIGCASAELAPQMAQVLAGRGTRGLVFRGRDGRDKMTTSAETDVWEVRDGVVEHHVITPEQLGLQRCAVEDLRGGSSQDNARTVRQILTGQSGPIRDAVLLNTAAGLVALEENGSGPLHQRLSAQMQRAAESIDSGTAADVLARWTAFHR
ncbi:anthranilate phosphoribosyltransferase [Nesterenkonia alba]|uniref:anthranilate phosphoribosyltransferase n=1 Tax=Nesterenkonia alba TaxID=515814 RepID=UPI0003B37437|nr:anthranilate phosphoribosyltransferase [Nesterenkonia alba]